MTVLYVDQENPQGEIRARLLSFGAKPGELELLAYLSFPAFGPLDTAIGAAAFHAAVEHYDSALIIFDTVSRMISGKENDADTWLAFYRFAIMPIKAARRASIRLDHFGKDRERGSRGSSAKTQDVDHVWELTEAGGQRLRLQRTHTRTGRGPDDIWLRREGKKGPDGGWLPGRTVMSAWTARVRSGSWTSW